MILQNKKHPTKNLRSLLGLGLKFIPTPRRTNIRKKLKETTMPKIQRAIHLRFHFAGAAACSGNAYDFKMYIWSYCTPTRNEIKLPKKLPSPHWRLPPAVLKDRLDKFSLSSDKLFKKQIGKTNLLPYQTRSLQLLQ